MCSDEGHHMYLATCLDSHFALVGAVIEPRASQIKRANKSLSDEWQYLYRQARRKFTKAYAHRYRYFGATEQTDLGNACPTLVVDWINEPQVVEFLSKTAHDAAIVMGTSIIRPNVLKASGPVTLNIHGGYLPYYRGNNCIFFALYNNERDKVGATIHFVNEGIDLGDIVEVVVPDLPNEDDDEALYSCAIRLAIDRLIEILEAWQEGSELPRFPQQMRGRLYLLKDRKPWHDFAMWVRRQLKVMR